MTDLQIAGFKTLAQTSELFVKKFKMDLEKGGISPTREKFQIALAKLYNNGILTASEIMILGLYASTELK